MRSTPQVLVAGGGVAGLVAARHLAAGGADVSLVERRETVGGRVRTRERDGYRFDRSFQVLCTAYPAVTRELDLEALRTERVSFAQFDQPPGFRDRLPDTRDPAGPVYLAGDYTQWSSIQGAMKSGRRAAKAVIDDLSR